MESQRPRKFRRQTRAGKTERPQGQGPRLLSTRNSSPSLTARALEDPAPPYPVEERPTLRVLKSSQKSGSTSGWPTSPPCASLRRTSGSKMSVTSSSQWHAGKVSRFGVFQLPWLTTAASCSCRLKSATAVDAADELVAHHADGNSPLRSLLM